MENSDILIAKEQLGQNRNVLVIVKNGEILFRSSKNGIQPFFDALDVHPRKSYAGSSIADKVVGKAALMLAAYIGAGHVYTFLASQHAVNSAKELELDLDARHMVPYIISRTHDGMCPMEETVLNVSDPDKAFELLSKKLESLK